MERIGIYDARARLSELVERVEAGEEVVLTRHGRPVVRMVAASTKPEKSGAATVKRIRALRKLLNVRGVNVRKVVEEGRR